MEHGIELIALAQLLAQQLRHILGEPRGLVLVILKLLILLDGILVGLGHGQLLFDR